MLYWGVCFISVIPVKLNCEALYFVLHFLSAFFGASGWKYAVSYVNFLGEV